MLLSALIAFFPLIHSAQDVADLLPTTEAAIEVFTEKSSSQFHTELDQFLAIPMEERTFTNTVRFWDFIQGGLLQATNCLEIIKEIHPGNEIRSTADEGFQKLKQTMVDALAKHPEIYPACLKTQKEDLTEQERYFLNELLFKFKHEGMQLEDKERAHFAEIKQEIAALESLFHRHVAEDTSHLFIPREELTGLDETWFASRNQNEQGYYQITPDLPTYAQIMTDCSNRNTRKVMLDLFTNRAFPQNEQVAVQLIEKRAQLAKLAGYPSYAAYDLSAQMIGSPERAEIFLKEIKDKADIKAADEFGKMTQNLPESVLLTPSGQLERFDEGYVFAQYQKQHFAIDQNLISEYFPLDLTIQGLIGIYEQFFDLSIEEVPHSISIPDIKALEIRNRSGQLLGVVLLDLFLREGKCSHSGVCSSIIYPYSPKTGPDYPAISLLICNLTKPTQDRPSLMKHRQVITFFHEFGHAIHSILGRNDFVSFCGMSVKFDFIEVPSKLLENWVWNPEILKRISSHYLTGAPLPDEVIENMIQARDFGTGGMFQRACYQSNLSLAFFGEKEVKDPTELMRQMWMEDLPHSAIGDNNHFHDSWWHFSDYGPKYYCYLWSEVFAADLFEKIQRGGLLNPAMGKEYSQAILSKGGSQDPEQMLIEFLGRKPSSESFLKQLRN